MRVRNDYYWWQDNIKSRIITCEKCVRFRASQIHHIDKNIKNNVNQNLLLVCRSCHEDLHHKCSLDITPTGKRVLPPIIQEIIKDVRLIKNHSKETKIKKEKIIEKLINLLREEEV